MNERPTTKPKENMAIRFYRYARAAASLRARLRDRVVYPWQARPLDPKAHPEARVPRGRLRNPTVQP